MTAASANEPVASGVPSGGQRLAAFKYQSETKSGSGDKMPFSASGGMPAATLRGENHVHRSGCSLLGQILPKPRQPWFWLAGAALLVSAGVVLFLFNPAEHSFFPFCPLHRLTGLNCPGCGSLRALHHLMHGRFAIAFQFNPLLVLALSCGLSYGIWRFSRQKSEPLRWPLFASPFWNWLLLGLIFGFGILRNVPVPVFSWFKV